MTVVVDTNVLISGIFFSGAPHDLLGGWLEGHIDLVASPQILEEYRQVVERLADRFPDVDTTGILEFITLNSLICADEQLPSRICDDPDDDKFLACALASGTKFVVTGDKALLRLDGLKGLRIVKPRDFVDTHLQGAED